MCVFLTCFSILSFFSDTKQHSLHASSKSLAKLQCNLIHFEYQYFLWRSSELKITCGHRSITVQNLIWTVQSMICMVIVSGQNMLHQKEPEIKFSHSLGKRDTRHRRLEAIIKSVAWSFRLCWISNFVSSEIGSPYCVRGVVCYFFLEFSAVFFGFRYLLGLYGCVQEIYDLFG